MRSPFQMVREELGLHDATTRSEVAFAAFLMLLLLPAYITVSVYERLGSRP